MRRLAVTVRLLVQDVLHRVLDLLASLLGVAFCLVAPAFDLQLWVVGDPPRGLLRLALDYVSLVVDLVSGSHSECLLPNRWTVFAA